MKYVLVALMSVFITSQAFAYNSNFYPYGNGVIVTTPQGLPVYVPRQTVQRPTLSGQGVTFATTLNITQKTIQDPVTKKDSVLKSYTAWVRNCGQVNLPENKNQEATARQGDRIELKFAKAGDCFVADWRKY